MKDVKYVLVWGTSSRHYPQHCGLSHILHDEDVVQIVKKKVQTVLKMSFLFCFWWVNWDQSIGIWEREGIIN